MNFCVDFREVLCFLDDDLICVSKKSRLYGARGGVGCLVLNTDHTMIRCLTHLPKLSLSPLISSLRITFKYSVGIQLNEKQTNWA